MRWLGGPHIGLGNGLISLVSARISPASGLACSVSVLRHTRLESPFTGLICALARLIGALTGFMSPLTTPACLPTDQRRSK